MKNKLFARLFNMPLGKLEVVTIRSPWGIYDHNVSHTGATQFTTEEIERMKENNIDDYEAIMAGFGNLISIKKVTSYIQRYATKDESDTYITAEKKAQNKSLALGAGAW